MAYKCDYYRCKKELPKVVTVSWMYDKKMVMKEIRTCSYACNIRQRAIREKRKLPDLAKKNWPML